MFKTLIILWKIQENVKNIIKGYDVIVTRSIRQKLKFVKGYNYVIIKVL